MSFADAERAATLACFSTAGIAVDVRFEPASGPAVMTTAIIEDESVVNGESPMRVAETVSTMRLLVSAVGDAKRGDRVVLLPDGPSYRLEHDVRRNSLERTYVVKLA